MHSHVAGPQMKEMVRRYRAGDVDGARKIDEDALAALGALTTSPSTRSRSRPRSPCSARTWAGYRLPMVPATDDELERVRDCLARAGLSVAAAAA